MRRLLFYLAVLAVPMPHAGAQAPAPYRPASLAAELRGLESAINNGSAPRLPAAWDVETPGRRYTISTEPLRTLLEAKPRGKTESDTRQAQQWLNALAQQLDSFESAPASPAGERARLDRILARPEFTAAHPPSALELWRRRIAAWFQELLRRIFGAMGSHPIAGEFIFFLVLAGCVGFLAVWLIHMWTGNRGMPALPSPGRAQLPLRTWEEWMAAAHRAAAEGDWRQAIHSAYWAAISRLQQSNALPAGLTNTPREYLRLISDPPTQHQLAALTTGLERFWYGRRAVRPGDFRESLTHLEELGCKLD